MKFALDVAMSGAFGVDMDLRKLASDERSSLAAGIALYKNEVCEVVEQGDLYRLESPYEKPRAALDFVSPDRARAVLFVYQLTNAPATPVKLCGLDPQRKYRVREVNLAGATGASPAASGKMIDGATLMCDGLQPSCHAEFDSAVFVLAGE